MVFVRVVNFLLKNRKSVIPDSTFAYPESSSLNELTRYRVKPGMTMKVVEEELKGSES
jgi:hypothetical protein